MRFKVRFGRILPVVLNYELAFPGNESDFVRVRVSNLEMRSLFAFWIGQKGFLCRLGYLARTYAIEIGEMCSVMWCTVL